MQRLLATLAFSDMYIDVSIFDDASDAIRHAIRELRTFDLWYS